MKERARAWRFERTGGPEVLELAEQELTAPGPGEALVRLSAIGLNRADLMHLAGRYFAPPPSPSFLGQEAVGEILALGPRVEGQEPVAGLRPEVGMPVGLMVGRIDFCAMGTYRTAGVFPQRALLPQPSSYTASEAAAYWVAAMTVVGGFAAGGLGGAPAPGKRVLVTAASSGVGVMALQIARALGTEAIAATTSSAKTEALAGLADHVLVVRSPADLATAVKSLTGGSGVDLAFDPVGGAYADGLLEAAAADGQVVFYGTLTGADAPLDLRKLILKDLGVHGYTVYRLQRDPARLEAVVEACLELAETGKVRPLVAARYPFEEAPAALAALARNEHLGKIVLEVD